MRIVVLGTGSIGLRHLNTLREMPGVQPIAVPVRQARVAELRAQGWEVATGISEALALAPAGAIVATDTGRHAQDAEALLACCDVLVEKPLASDGVAARRVVERARASGRRAHIACCLRFDAGLMWVRERVARLGRLRLADAECLSWLPDWRPGRDHLSSYAARPGEGGVLLDLIHDIDYCSWLVGPITRVAARLTNDGAVGLPPSVEETASLLLEHAGGLTTTLRLSYAVRPPTRRLRLWGERGRLEWDAVTRRAIHLDADGHELDAMTWVGPQAMYQAQAEAWVASVRGEPTTGLADAIDGAAAVAVCDAARRAARSGRWEQVS